VRRAFAFVLDVVWPAVVAAAVISAGLAYAYLAHFWVFDPR